MESSGAPRIKIKLLVAGPSGVVPLNREISEQALPTGPEKSGPPLLYGRYLQSLREFLTKQSFKPVRTALELKLKRMVDLKEIIGMDVTSQKHGAFYHVAKVKVLLKKESHSFVVNTAVLPTQQAFLESEYELLQSLRARFPFNFLPTPYCKGKTTYKDPHGKTKELKLFMAGWFEDYHEFHLCTQEDACGPLIEVWKSGSDKILLDRGESGVLYHKAAAILTAYLDEESFHQIYPWHHAAGDFVVKIDGRDLKVKLIAARDYRCLMSPGPEMENIWMAIVHFFLNLTLRLRLDRIDGTGKLVWASPHCLKDVLSGFLDSWNRKREKAPHLPSSEDVLRVLSSFSATEWEPVAEFIVENSYIEKEEIGFLKSHLGEHLVSLTNALNRSAQPG